MDERKKRVKQARALVRLATQRENRVRRERVTLENLFLESFNEELPYPLTEIPLQPHGDFHIPFKTAKWQEWWGEGFYRRDGNDTPRSLEPEVAALQELFAGVKRRHQENNLQWRKDLTEYLLGLETACSKPPEFSDEYIISFPGTFDIPFKSDEYKYWWDRCTYDVNSIPTDMYGPFEQKFFDLTHKIHMAMCERRLDAARSLINELSEMVEQDRLSIASSIASNVIFPARL